MPVDNFKTQKGILAHCERLNHKVVRDEDIELAYVGQPATFHINGDSYADEVIAVKRDKKTGLVREVVSKGGARFVVRVSANCQSKIDGNGWYHVAGLSGLNCSGWLELGIAVTRHDPHF